MDKGKLKAAAKCTAGFAAITALALGLTGCGKGSKNKR